MMKLPLVTPLPGIRGIGPAFLKRLKNLGLETVRDLLWHFPARYEDFSQIYKIAELQPGQQATIQGTVEGVESRRTWKRRLTVTETVISDESGSIKATWFNQPYVENSLKPGRVFNFAGKVSVSQEGELYLSNPAYEFTNGKGQMADKETRHTARLVPIYPETRGLTSKGLRFLIQPILANLEYIKEWVPKWILEENNFPEINEALKNIHFPEKPDDGVKARKRFEFEGLFLLQLYNLEQKLKLASEKASVIKTDIERLKKTISDLPFGLTRSQKRSLWEIIQDIEKPRPMNRLLQGDVGSGKTIVAALAAIITAENGLQTAFMAPTEVLAKQHFETLKKLFKNVKPENQPTLGLLTSASQKIFYETDIEANIKKTEISKKIKDGEIEIIIGTHALISGGNGKTSLKFKNLGLVVIDEQHRFGIRQRAALARDTNDANARESGKNKKFAAPDSRRSHRYLPHFLSMSATPIPRTLTMTIFGDLDISLITELPAGRKNIITKIVEPNGRAGSYQFMREEIKSGRQAFVICPRIEQVANPHEPNADERANRAPAFGSQRSGNSERQSALWDVKSVKEEYEKLSKKIFPDLKVQMLHGKMKPKEKEKIMKDFRDGKTDILVSTSVVEVGVDIPNATIMMIEGADRFGLAQLYQFRGRVGRGEHQSYCLLFTDSPSKTTNERLRAILEAKNGFELAEKDLEIRGPGELLGTSQTGIPDSAMSALRNIELVKASREAAGKILKEDAVLKKYPALKSELEKFESKIHLE